MEDVSVLQLLEGIRCQLASCQEEVSALGWEALSSATSDSRRVEALIKRAAIQTRVIVLMQALEKFETKSSGDCSPRVEREQNSPWPRYFTR